MRETDLRADFEWEGLLEDSETKKKLDAFFPLEEKEDADIKPEDYLAIVRRIVDRFREAVRKNLRTRVLANPWNHLRQAVLPDPFSWTEAMGELYESLIFSKVKDDEPDGPRWLNDLFIPPAGRVEGGFSPGLHHWSRKAKVPVLVLNATTLNTGHTWQFTASWMGEPPAGVDKEVDSNPRLRRMYYHEAPRPFQRIRLGRAVAASSCVPGLFPPIVFDGLYQKDYVLKLVDGGVHDNQGSRGLLEQDCNVLLISDASGQMESETKVSGSALQVLPRSNNILQSRVREAQFLDLDSRRRSLQLKGLMFIHLRKSLSSEAVDWIDAKEGPSSDRGDPDTMAPRRYGIAEEIQEKTAALRTDLDSFSDSEAYALMYEGYRMTEVELPLAIAWLAGREGTRQEWKFLAARDRMAPSRPDTGFERALEVGKRNGFKLFALEPWLGWLLGGLSAAGLGALAMAAIRNGTFLNLLKGMVWISGIAVAAFLVSLLLRSVSPRAAEAQEALIRRLVGLGMGTLGWIPFFLHLKVFDPLFLWSGRLKPAEPDPGRPGSRADKQP